MCESFSNILCIKKFKNFDFDNYPFVLSREEEYVCILNVRTSYILKVITQSAYCEGPTCDLMNFVGNDSDLAFVTNGGNFELIKYSIKHELMKILNEN